MEVESGHLDSDQAARLFWLQGCIDDCKHLETIPGKSLISKLWRLHHNHSA